MTARRCYCCSLARPGWVDRFDAYRGRVIWVRCLVCNHDARDTR